MSAIDHQFDAQGVQAPLEDVTPAGVRGWLERSSLTAKLNIAVLGNTIVLALVAAALLGGTFFLGEGGRTQAVIASIEVRTNNAAIAMVDVFEGLEAAGEAQSPRARTTALRDAASGLDLAYETLTDPIEFAGDRMPADVGPKVIGLRDQVDALRSDLAADRSAASIAELEERARTLYRDMSRFAVDYHVEAAASADRLFGAISQFLIVFLVLVVAGVSVSLFGARHIIRNTVSSVRAFTSAMQALANGDTDVEIPGRSRRDELGEMAKAMTVFQSSSLALRDLTAERARDAETQLARQQEANAEAQALRAEQSAMLSDLANGFDVSVGEVIASVQSAAETLRTTSKDMVDLAKSSVGQSGEASEAMEAATRNVTAAAAATDEFALSITEISRQATASASLAREANELVGSANTKMSDLSEAAQEIGEIAGLIQTIAQRTNLLALNASIEAARGGEAGRGFAVVASEVKELATQTSHATSSVAEKIAAMQNSTEASASDLSAIVEQIAKLEEASVVIASAVDQQSRSGEDLARNIDTVAAGSVDIGDRLEALKKASHETGAAAGNVLHSAEDLGRQADTLQAKASQFISQVQTSSVDMLSAGEAAAVAKAQG
ncbi:MAG: HAMP domain-containing protein [Erythrobacter sp.]|nr:HAMP domain-containing protein [Erythrobacter sp.]